jgi:hypothetical protein
MSNRPVHRALQRQMADIHDSLMQLGAVVGGW